MILRHPKDLAEFRVWLWKQWQPHEWFWEVAQRSRKERRIPGQEWIPLEAIFDDRALVDAQLYWVSAEMAALIDTASRSLPPTTLTAELVPAPSGLVWFEQPLIGKPATLFTDLTGIQPQDIAIRAMVWGESQIPPGPHAALGISTYAESGILAPAGRTDWEWGEDSDAPIDVSIKDDLQRVESMAEDRRWMATFWLLLSQTGIADTSIVRPMPKLIRKGKRAIPGLTSDQFTVRVVNVHRPKNVVQNVDSPGRKVDWSHRWIVNPFWRQQAYGPNRSLRRPMLIDSYIKGPGDKPLKIKPTVHVLKDGEL